MNAQMKTKIPSSTMWEGSQLNLSRTGQNLHFALLLVTYEAQSYKMPQGQ